MTPSRALALLAAITVLVAGCSDDDDARPTPTATEPAAAVALVIYTGEPNGDAALLTGRLSVAEGCVCSEVSTGERFLIAFPEGHAEWDEAKNELDFGGQRYALGDEIGLGGSEAFDGFDAWVTPPAAACDTEHIWIAGSTVT